MTFEERQLEKALKFLELSQNDTLTPREVEQFIHMLVDLIAKSKQGFDKTAADNLKKIKDFLNSVEGEHSALVSQISREVNRAIETCAKAAEDIRTFKPKDGEPGVSPDPQEIIREVSKAMEPLIPTIDAIEKDLPKLGAPIRDALELLQGDERLDKSAIKGLEEWQKTVEVKASKPGSIQGGGLVGRDIIKRYDLPVDGLTSTFVLPAFWYIIDVRSSSAPIAFKYNTDWTSDSTSITFTSEINPATTLAADQTVYIIYVTA